MVLLILKFSEKEGFDKAVQNYEKDLSQLIPDDINYEERIIAYQPLPDEEGGKEETLRILAEELTGISYSVD